MSALVTPALGIALLFGTEPGDRALSGWSPLASVQAEFGGFLRYHGCPPPPLATSIPGFHGPFRQCARGHEQVSWAGDSGCWCCAPPDSGDPG